MVQINQEVPIQAQPQIASYDWTDIAEGTGIVELYGATGELTGGEFYYLSENTEFSKTGATSGTISSSQNWEKGVDVDFDLPEFQFSKTLKGKGRCFAQWGYGSGSSVSGNSYVIIKVRKWDGTTETDLVSAQTQTEARGDVSGIDYFTGILEFDIPKTHFKRGDVLRLTVEVWGQNTESASNTVRILHNPKNAEVTGNNTAQYSFLKFNLPFRIDIS